MLFRSKWHFTWCLSWPIQPFRRLLIKWNGFSRKKIEKWMHKMKFLIYCCDSPWVVNLGLRKRSATAKKTIKEKGPSAYDIAIWIMKLKTIQFTFSHQRWFVISTFYLSDIFVVLTLREFCFSGSYAACQASCQVLNISFANISLFWLRMFKWIVYRVRLKCKFTTKKIKNKTEMKIRIEKCDQKYDFDVNSTMIMTTIQSI